jgi:hypothetical protein
MGVFICGWEMKLDFFKLKKLKPTSFEFKLDIVDQ